MAELLGPAFAGSFYPGDSSTLERTVKGFLNCGIQGDPDVLGLVLPHAGYVYSGRTAGMGFALAPDNVETVVVCAPSHRRPIPEAAVFPVKGIETPLGVCPVDTGAVSILSKSLDTAVFHEHSFEVMIPFIQLRWPGARVVPVITGIDPDCGALAELLYKTVPEALFIASSDLSHFHSLKEAEVLDRRVIQGFLSMDPEVFRNSIRAGGEACGRDPIETLLRFGTPAGAMSAEEIRYCTSADAGADAEEVVGYFAGALRR